jgi:hypothetical protein
MFDVFDMFDFAPVEGDPFSKPFQKASFLVPPANDEIKSEVHRLSPSADSMEEEHRMMEEGRGAGVAISPGMFGGGLREAPPVPVNTNVGMQENIGPANTLQTGIEGLGIGRPVHSFVANDVPSGNALMAPRTGNVKAFMSPEVFNWKPAASKYLTDLAEGHQNAGNSGYADMVNQTFIMGPKLAKQWLDSGAYGQNVILKGYLERALQHQGGE